jgi:hypothetical protein
MSDNLIPIHSSEEILLKRIMKVGSDVNVVNREGITPLSAIVRQSSRHLTNVPEIMHYLISKGADVNLADEEGNTPLAVCQNPILAGHLISSGAKLDLEAESGKTLLNTAVMSKNSKLVAVLLEKGAREWRSSIVDDSFFLDVFHYWERTKCLYSMIILHHETLAYIIISASRINNARLLCHTTRRYW